MSGHSLDAAYFDGVFADGDDPWSLASSAYEAAKFDATIAALGGRRFRSALEIGCAHGVLTRRLASSCDRLQAVDISGRAVELARERCAGLANVRIERMTIPAEWPASSPSYDLIILSEVVYYWNDPDIAAAARMIGALGEPGAWLLLVHWIRETDYPQTGDDAVTKLRAALGDAITVVQGARNADYRLDRWIFR